MTDATDPQSELNEHVSDVAEDALSNRVQEVPGFKVEWHEAYAAGYFEAMYDAGLTPEEMLASIERDVQAADTD